MVGHATIAAVDIDTGVFFLVVSIKYHRVQSACRVACFVIPSVYN